MFANREEGGRLLGKKLQNRPLHDPLVLGIPRGGVVTGAALAQEIGAELDVVLVRKLRAPGQPELAIGSLSETGEVHLDPQAEYVPGFSQEYLTQEVRRQQGEIARRGRMFRAVRPPAAMAGRSMIVTDDGIATGSTMFAALKAVRANNPKELILAVPVASPDRLPVLARLCDETVCLLQPEDFAAVGEFYLDFTQVEDEEAVELLRKFNKVVS